MKIITFGELMIRLQPYNYERFVQADHLEFSFGGAPYSRSFNVHFSFFTFFTDFVIFQVVKWMFLIFHDFQFSCHIPRPTVDISKFSTFFSFPRQISRPKVCISHFP